ncbi:MAG: hypothetical protein JXB17_11730 [Bacteroidales bacterium]|nr:hypothetical protein [Bacteroidales bacterium]
MKKYLIIVILILLNVKCNNNKKNATIFQQEINNYFHNMISYYSINKIILNNILDFIYHCDSITASNQYISKKNIFSLGINNYKENCYFIISTADCYVAQRMIGYFIVNNRMLVFYSLKPSCNFDFIKEKYLYKGLNKRYIEINEALEKTFEPYGRLYQIIDRDSLKLLKEGYNIQEKLVFDNQK